MRHGREKLILGRWVEVLNFLKRDDRFPLKFLGLSQKGAVDGEGDHLVLTVVSQIEMRQGGEVSQPKDDDLGHVADSL